MKRIVLLLFLIIQYSLSQAQSTGSFFVNGDPDKFYPVVFADNNWDINAVTELELCRSSIHQDANLKGALMSKFTFHVTRWGNESQFVNLDLAQRNSFIAGYKDATLHNPSHDFIVWLRGNTSYFFKSNATQSPRIYDGVNNSLPFQEENGSAHTYKTSVDSTLNSKGQSIEGTTYFHGAGLNYMFGNLGLGTLDTKGFKLAVNGGIRAHEIKVETANWPDYVFEENYSLTSLAAIENYIKINKHLPEMPSAAEVEKNGLNLGQNNAMLLKKIEELTLILIDKDKQLQKQGQEIESVKVQLQKLAERMDKH